MRASMSDPVDAMTWTRIAGAFLRHYLELKADHLTAWREAFAELAKWERTRPWPRPASFLDELAGTDLFGDDAERLAR